MTSVRARLSPRMYRGFRWGLAVVSMLGAGVAASGIALLFTTKPSERMTELAQRGWIEPAGTAFGTLQDIHSSLTLVFVLGTLGLAAWLLGVAIGDWSWPLVLAFGVVIVAAISGEQAGYIAVSIDGTYRADLTGYGFLADPGFDNIVNAGRIRSAAMFRFWVLLHLLSLPAALLLSVHGIRRWRQS